MAKCQISDGDTAIQQRNLLIWIFSQKDHSLQAEALVICFYQKMHWTTKLRWSCRYRVTLPHYKAHVVGQRCEKTVTIPRHELYLSPSDCLAVLPLFVPLVLIWMQRSMAISYHRKAYHVIIPQAPYIATAGWQTQGVFSMNIHLQWPESH